MTEDTLNGAELTECLTVITPSLGNDAIRPKEGVTTMSHNIVNNMLAYAGETPWHGLGTSVERATTGLEMLRMAKLDWTVQRRMLAMRDAQGGGLLTSELSAFRAIVRQDTNEVFQVATDRYHPLQNAEIVEFFREYCEAGHATLETVGGLNGGSKIWALARLNGGSQTMLGGLDELRGYMLLATSHDGSLRTIGKPTQTRVVCWNTLSAAIGERSQSEFRMKHTRKWTPEVASEARRVMGMAIEQVQKTNELAALLSLATVDRRGTEEFVLRTTLTDDEIKNAVRVDFSTLVPNRAAESILEAIKSGPGSDLPTAQGTLWGALNGVTFYADHQYGRSQDTRLSAAWFGPGDALKNRAVSVARDMAAIRVR